MDKHGRIHFLFLSSFRFPIAGLPRLMGRGVCVFDWLALAVIGATAAISPADAQTVESKTVCGQVYISSEFIINARADSVVLRLVHTATLADIMEYDYRSGAKWLLKIGDAASITPRMDKFGQRDTGVIILSSFRPPSELCFTFEPDRGNYVCQENWKCIASAGNQTRVVVTVRLIDSEGAQSSGQISQRQRMIRQRLEKLKLLSERK